MVKMLITEEKDNFSKWYNLEKVNIGRISITGNDGNIMEYNIKNVKSITFLGNHYITGNFKTDMVKICHEINGKFKADYYIIGTDFPVVINGFKCTTLPNFDIVMKNL